MNAMLSLMMLVLVGLAILAAADPDPYDNSEYCRIAGWVPECEGFCTMNPWECETRGSATATQAGFSALMIAFGYLLC